MKLRFGIFVLTLILALSFVGAATAAPLNYSDFIALGRTGTAPELRDAIKTGVEAGIEVETWVILAAATEAARHNSDAGVTITLLEQIADEAGRFYTAHTLLTEAARHNSNPEVVIALVEYYLREHAAENVDRDFAIGMTLLEAAIKHNRDAEFILATFGHMTDEAQKKFTVDMLLLEAVRNNSNPEIIIASIENGADINERHVINGHTPLMLAASNPNPEIILILLEMGADPNVLSSCRVYKALHLAQNNEALRDTEALRALEAVTKPHDVEAAERNAAAADGIISNFRSLQSASLMFFAFNLDVVRADTPPAAIVINGENFALDPTPDIFLLTQYLDNPDAPEWYNHKFKFTGTGPLEDRWWWIGLNLNDAGKGDSVRYLLSARAEFVNLFGDTDTNVAYTDQDVVWMLVRAPWVE